MEENTKNAGQGLGVAALVMGIISFIVAFIPCVGLFALFTSAIAIVLGAIGLSQASKSNSPKGLMMGGLILGIIALFVAIAQVVLFAGLADKAPYFEEKFEDVIKDLEKDVFNDGNFSITIDDGEDKIEINSTVKRELRDALDELEDLEEDLKDVDETSLEIKIKIDTSGDK